MADNIAMPSGGGGLLRYSEEYPSKFKISPEMVIILIAIVITAMTILKLIA